MVRSSEVQAAGTDAEVVRRATGADAQQLRAVGERLVEAAHPGVVEVVSSTGTDDEWELRVVHGGRPIELVGPLSVEQVAGATAAVAAILADLHRAGIVHGSIDGSHVLIGSHGRPVLCGFADASTPAAPEDDVAALGALIVALLGTDAELEPIPDHRWRRPASFSGWTRRSLLLVADQACADPPSRRPSAARLATAIAEAVPGAVAVADPAGAMSAEPAAAVVETAQPDPFDVLRSEVDAAPGPVRLPALAGAVVAVIILAAGALRLAQPGSGTTPGVAAPAALSSAPSTSSTPETVATDLPPTTVPTSLSVPCPASASAAPALAGCGPITIDGSTVMVGARRYEVGQAGDLVVAGDWDCDGIPTPALLRPSSGEVFVFSGWAGDDDIVVHPVATVTAGEALVTDVRDGGCSTLAVRRADGTRLPINAASVA